MKERRAQDRRAPPLDGFGPSRGHLVAPFLTPIIDRMEEGQEDIRRHIAAWRIAHDFLERERVERLRAMTDDECRAVIARIFNGPRPATTERSSGLIEQQRLFRKLR